MIRDKNYCPIFEDQLEEKLNEFLDNESTAEILSLIKDKEEKLSIDELSDAEIKDYVFCNIEENEDLKSDIEEALEKAQNILEKLNGKKSQEALYFLEKAKDKLSCVFVL